MTVPARAWAAVTTLAAVLAIAASWWALALWPVDPAGPDWLLRTREVCFGSTPDGLPNAGGWLLLVGQPLGMLGLLAVVWGEELRAGLSLLMARVAGQLAVGVASALIVAGVSSAMVRVRTAGLEPFSTGAEIARQLTRVNDKAPALALTDQHGREIALESFRGRPVVVTFAYAHCETICPVIVTDALGARQKLAGDPNPPVVLVVTLDPWRDTPSRLPAIAREWGLAGNVHLLSGAPEVVERALNAWRVPRTRNTKTGEIAHPSIVYVVDVGGRIAYVVNGGADAIAAAVRSL
jgi:cytochrome oxidase Cu insertion factor (SCO1/SenC/PrrC family)